MAIEPTKLRPGQKVKYVNRNGIPLTGKIIDIEQGATGQFVKANFGDARNPLYKKIRPSQLQRV